MSLINSGFDGTVTERDFSRIMRGAGVRDSVETVAAWAVTQGTGRQVSVAPGVAYAAGVVSDSGVAILAALPTPVNGQWHLVVRRINWASNTVTVATIPHTTTTTTIPTAPPAGFPVFNDNTGVLVDQHLAWAWVRSTDTTVAVFDLRSLPPARGVDLPVANVAALPTLGNFVGRQITALDTGITFRWSGSAWLVSVPSHVNVRSRKVAVTNVFTNTNATWTVLPQAADKAALDMTFVKDLAGSKLVVNLTTQNELLSGTAGGYLQTGIRIGSTDYEVAFWFPQAVGRARTAGIVEITGVAAGSLAITPIVRYVGVVTSAVQMVALAQDFIHYSVEETF